VIPKEFLEFLSPKVEVSKDIITQIIIEKPLPTQKIEMPKPRPKPKEEEPEPEPLKEERLANVAKEQIIPPPEPEAIPKEVITQQIEPVTEQKVDFYKIVMNEYQRRVRNKIEQAKRYPLFARRNEIEGIVKVQFTILSNGNVENIKVLKSSKTKILDESIYNTIKSVLPFPPLPKELNTDHLQLQIEIVFKLE